MNSPNIDTSDLIKNGLFVWLFTSNYGKEKELFKYQCDLLFVNIHIYSLLEQTINTYPSKDFNMFFLGFTCSLYLILAQKCIDLNRKNMLDSQCWKKINNIYDVKKFVDFLKAQIYCIVNDKYYNSFPEIEESYFETIQLFNLCIQLHELIENDKLEPSYNIIQSFVGTGEISEVHEALEKYKNTIKKLTQLVNEKFNSDQRLEFVTDSKISLNNMLKIRKRVKLIFHNSNLYVGNDIMYSTCFTEFMKVINGYIDTAPASLFLSICEMINPTELFNLEDTHEIMQLKVQTEQIAIEGVKYFFNAVCEECFKKLRMNEHHTDRYKVKAIKTIIKDIIFENPDIDFYIERMYQIFKKYDSFPKIADIETTTETNPTKNEIKEYLTNKCLIE